MTGHQDLAIAYEQLYSAAAHMLWAQETPGLAPGIRR